VLAAGVFFLAGVGTASLVIMNRLTSMAGLPLAGGPSGSGGAVPKSGPPAPGDAGGDLSAWARGQGLSEGLPEQILQTLRQQYPEGVPQEARDRLQEQFGG
jgi:hypothetical protein